MAGKLAIHAVWFGLIFLAGWAPGAGALGLGSRLWSVGAGNFVVSICAVILGYLGITALCAWWTLIWCGGLTSSGGSWAIGFGSGLPAVSQYATILPVAITDSAGYIGILAGSLGVNAVVLIVAAAVWAVLASRREDFYYRG